MSFFRWHRVPLCSRKWALRLAVLQFVPWLQPRRLERTHACQSSDPPGLERCQYSNPGWSVGPWYSGASYTHRQVRTHRSGTYSQVGYVLTPATGHPLSSYFQSPARYIYSLLQDVCHAGVVAVATARHMCVHSAIQQWCSAAQGARRPGAPRECNSKTHRDVKALLPSNARAGVRS